MKRITILSLLLIYLIKIPVAFAGWQRIDDFEGSPEEPEFRMNEAGIHFDADPINHHNTVFGMKPVPGWGAEIAWDLPEPIGNGPNTLYLRFYLVVENAWLPLLFFDDYIWSYSITLIPDYFHTRECYPFSAEGEEPEMLRKNTWHEIWIVMDESSEAFGYLWDIYVRDTATGEVKKTSLCSWSAAAPVRATSFHELNYRLTKFGTSQNDDIWPTVYLDDIYIDFSAKNLTTPPGVILPKTSWHGYSVVSGHYVDTDDWLGWLYILHENDWVYSFRLGGWIYVPERDTEGWIYVPRY